LDQLEIIAHRGESHEAPENTLAAFRLAWKRQADAIELDVHLTRDGHLIVCHDADTYRTTGVSLAIRDRTMDDLRRLDAGSWKGPKWKGERLPSLEEALDTMPRGGRCFVELKCGSEGVPALVKAVRSANKSSDQIAIISFHSDALAEAKRCLPELSAYFLASVRRDAAAGKFVPDIGSLIETARSVGADGLDLSLHALEEPMVVDQIKDAGLGLYVWTVDDPDTARKAAALGVDGITTNQPAWLRAQLADFSPDRAADALMMERPA
jgi:glycerophosphoryl diester phosphodiesterase